MNRLREGQSILIVRYTTKIQSDCIEQHIKLIKNNRECWFGMLGAISNKTKSLILKSLPSFIVLYNRAKCYICEIADISAEKPENGYPEYYQKVLFAEGVFPKTYLRLLSIEEFSIENLNNLFVSSTGKTAIETLNLSMASMIIVSNKKPEEEHGLLGINECIYRKNGICENKNCISFKYDCEKPSRCLKQKR